MGWGSGVQPPSWDPAPEPPLPSLQNGVISLIDCTLVEEQESTDEDGRCPRPACMPRALLSPCPRVQPGGVGLHTSQQVPSRQGHLKSKAVATPGPPLLRFHRITNWFGLEGTLKILLSNLTAMGRDIFH